MTRKVHPNVPLGLQIRVKNKPSLGLQRVVAASFLSAWSLGFSKKRGPGRKTRQHTYTQKDGASVLPSFFSRHRVSFVWGFQTWGQERGICVRLPLMGWQTRQLCPGKKPVGRNAPQPSFPLCLGRMVLRVPVTYRSRPVACVLHIAGCSVGAVVAHGQRGRLGGALSTPPQCRRCTSTYSFFVTDQSSRRRGRSKGRGHPTLSYCHRAFPLFRQLTITRMHTYTLVRCK
nr:hypothetical protein [Pandoravirus massiliensis]